MIANLEEDNYYCFGCNVSGDAADFVKHIEKDYNNLNDLQAYIKYNKILKSDKVSDIKLRTNIGSKDRSESSEEDYNIAYDYYFGLRTVDWKVPNELERNPLIYMEKRGFTKEALNKAKAKYTFNDNYELVFPMFDNDEFKGWVCRTTDKQIEKKRKYLYNKGFSRATTLVGNYGSKNYVILVEGYMDRLKLIQLGVSNVVAILGWKITQEQIEKLKSKGVTTIISALDNDKKGREGTKYLEKYFKVIKFKYLKGIKDPGDMTKESFKKMWNKTKEEVRKKKE